jgi:hypothetical protein
MSVKAFSNAASAFLVDVYLLVCNKFLDHTYIYILRH